MTRDTDAASQQRKQQVLVANYELTFVGTGSEATGSGAGWWASSRYFFRCRRCGYYMNLATDPDTESCHCGALHKEPGRFGSSFGDDEIDVYVARHRQTGAYFESY